MQDGDEEPADEDPDMEGELTSADYRKLQSLVDEQEQAVQAGDHPAAPLCSGKLTNWQLSFTVPNHMLS